MAKPTTTTPAVYFQSLTVANVKCFHDEQTIDLSDGEGGFARWTVILGNNNTGKTTLLKSLAGFSLENYLDKRHEIEYYVTFINSLSNFSNVHEKNYEVLLNNKLLKGMVKAVNSDDYYFNENFYNENTDEIKIKINLTSLINTNLNEFKSIKNFKIFSYGTSRKMSNRNWEERYSKDIVINLFDERELMNSEKWISNIYSLTFDDENSKFMKMFNNIKIILTNGVLPDVSDIRIQKKSFSATDIQRFVECLTPYGWVPMDGLGYGYQSMMGWVLDLVRRMIDRYPESENPLAEPAIVLVDEIDLHLHPEWQRKIISHLTKHFPNTQFIVTAHSPLIVQSAEEVNVVLLKKDGDHVRIEQPKLRDYRGWSVEEILSDLMGMDNRVRSDEYIALVEQFDKALDNDDFVSAQAAYGGLVKLLPAQSHERKLFRIQMAGLTPQEA